MSDYSDDKNPYYSKNCEALCRTVSQNDLARIYKRAFLAGEKARFTDEEKRFFMDVVRESDGWTLESDEDRDLWHSIQKKVTGE